MQISFFPEPSEIRGRIVEVNRSEIDREMAWVFLAGPERPKIIQCRLPTGRWTKKDWDFIAQGEWTGSYFDAVSVDSYRPGTKLLDERPALNRDLPLPDAVTRVGIVWPVSYRWACTAERAMEADLHYAWVSQRCAVESRYAIEPNEFVDAFLRLGRSGAQVILVARGGEDGFAAFNSRDVIAESLACGVPIAVGTHRSIRSDLHRVVHDFGVPGELGNYLLEATATPYGGPNGGLLDRRRRLILMVDPDRRLAA
jgi:hypothetical protein